MAKAVIENLRRQAVHGFTVDQRRDQPEPEYEAGWTTEPADIFRALFFGLGSDGTVGANKNTIRSSAKRPASSRRATSSTTPRKPAP